MFSSFLVRFSGQPEVLRQYFWVQQHGLGSKTEDPTSDFFLLDPHDSSHVSSFLNFVFTYCCGNVRDSPVGKIISRQFGSSLPDAIRRYSGWRAAVVRGAAAATRASKDILPTDGGKTALTAADLHEMVRRSLIEQVVPDVKEAERSSVFLAGQIVNDMTHCLAADAMGEGDFLAPGSGSMSCAKSAFRHLFPERSDDRISGESRLLAICSSVLKYLNVEASPDELESLFLRREGRPPD
jgi:hypothetical protein